MPTDNANTPKRPNLWREWDKVMDDPSNPVARQYRRNSDESRKIDQAIHKTPVSRLQIDQLKAQRLVPRAQATLTPTGQMHTYAVTSLEAVRERKIGFGEKRLGRLEGEALRGFERTQGRFLTPRRSGPSR